MRLATALAAGIIGCSAPPPANVGTPAPAVPTDTLVALLPAGYGTLRQDDLSLRLDVFSLQVRALPLDESVLRTLASDSYRALHELRESQRDQLTAITRRTGVTRFSLWYVSFFSVEPGETRFNPMDLVITNVGRDFRPLAVLPLTPGFGQNRVRQRETHSAVYVFEGQLDANQPLTVTYETTRNGDWSATLQRIERERQLIRSRARS
ncbi:MAG TPA: hypothetical protein VJ717_11325 [Gemmatimonadaceae bacterium]|nr:hypothetical protein [Gemmatimonadaceae bacterium]